MIYGPEFGEHEGKKAMIRRALYGGKADSDYWLHLCSCMIFFGFRPCKADHDIWMRKAERVDNINYREYVLLLVDDCICISTDPETIARKEW